MYIDITFIYNLSLNTNLQPAEQCKFIMLHAYIARCKNLQ